MATQEQDTYLTGSRGASNAAGSLSAGNTVTAFSPASNGDNWIVQIAPSAYSFSGTQGQVTGATTVNIITLNGVDSLSNPKQWYDSNLTARFQKTASGDAAGLVARCTDSNHYYRASVVNNQLQIVKDVNGTLTTLGTFAFTDGGSKYWIRFLCEGFGVQGTVNNLQAKVWLDGNSEPGSYNITVSDASLTAVGYVGLHFKGTATGNIQSVDSFTAIDPITAIATPTYNVTQQAPYVFTTFVGSGSQIMSQQLVTDLTALENGVANRWQAKWTFVETAQNIYNWAPMDDLVYRCNQAGIRVIWPIQSPPSWRQTVDAYGNDSTLNGTLTASTPYTSMTVTALRAGAQLPHQGQLTVDYGGAHPENVYIWNPSGNVTAGATSIGISTSKVSQVAWTPAFTHSIGAKIYEATGGPQLANASDFATFAGLAAARYNGTAGYGKVDIFQVENEAYDSGSWIGAQSPAWDIGGSLLAPVYYAVRNAILAQYPGVPVIPCSVRKTPTLAVAHITNWLTYLITGIQALGGTLDGIDAHYYRSTSNFDGTLTVDPTLNTYTDGTLTVVNTPCIALEISTIKAALATYGVTNAQINVWETGWDLYSGGGGVLTTLSVAVPASTPISSISVASTPAFIGDGTPIFFDYNTISNSEGPVYAWGNAPLHSTTIQITTNARGSFATQASFTPTKTHAINSQTYAVTDANIVSQALQSQYIQAVAEQLRITGCTSVGIFTDNAAATVTTTLNPETSTSQKSLAWTPSGGAYTYAQAYTDLKNTYIPAHPTWPAPTTYKATALSFAPIADYRLDETSGTVAHDISGNGNNGILSGVSTYSAASLIYNDTDAAMTFTGSGGVALPHNLNPETWSALSIVYWIQLSAGIQSIIIANDATGTVVYLNGQLYTPGTVGSIEIDPDFFYTGSYQGSTLDEVMFLNYKLSATAALILHQAGAAPTTPPPPTNVTPPIPLGMKIILGYVAMPTADATSVRYKATTADPVPTCSVEINDSNSSIQVQALQELWILDGNIIPYPSWNLLQTPQLGTGAGANWFISGPGGITINLVQPVPVTIVASSSSNSEFANQNIQQGLVVPGQQYMFSAYLQAATALTQFQAILQLSWLDAAWNVISTTTNQFTPSGTRTRYNVSGTAPAGAVSARVQFGGIALVNGSANGTINVDTCQFEPMWFPSQLAYPTPDLLPTSTNARMLPNETVIRQYRKFAGLVTHAIAQDYHGNTRTWHIDASGYAWLFGQTFTILSFQQEYDINIISALLSYFWPARQDGTTLFNLSGMIQGVQVSSLQPNWDDLRTLINDLATQAGYFWTIDPYWVFVYQPPGYTQMPISLICDHSGTPDFVSSFTAYNFKAELDFTQPGSSILVIGGNVSTTLTVGLNTGSYYTQLQVAPLPAPILAGTVMSLSGIQGVVLSQNARAGATQVNINRFQALYNHGFGASLSSNPYVGNVIDMANSSTYNQMAMYGYGNGQLGIGGIPGSFFMRKINDSALQSVPDVINRGIAELIQYDNPRWIYHLSTNAELLVGQGIQVTSNTDNLNATTLLIQQITAQWLGTDEKMNPVWEYQADLGAVNRSASSIMSHIFRQTTVNTSPPSINQTALFLMERFGMTETVTGH